MADDLLHDLTEDPSLQRLASRLIDHLGALGWNVIVHRIGLNAEGGWELQAWRDEGIGIWTVRDDSLYSGIVELTQQLGFDLME